MRIFADNKFAAHVQERKYYETRKRWIAAVRGSALAGGMELSLACDMIVCSEDGRFGLPEVKRGLFAGAGGVHRLPRAIPRNISMELIATGDPMDAKRAFELGLVNRLASTDKVFAVARQLAQEIAINAPFSVRESLTVARMAQESSDAKMRPASKEAAARVMNSEDAIERPRAFLEKRTPNWTGH